MMRTVAVNAAELKVVDVGVVESAEITSYINVDCHGTGSDSLVLLDASGKFWVLDESHRKYQLFLNGIELVVPNAVVTMVSSEDRSREWVVVVNRQGAIIMLQVENYSPTLSTVNSSTVFSCQDSSPGFLNCTCVRACRLISGHCILAFGNWAGLTVCETIFDAQDNQLRRIGAPVVGTNTSINSLDISSEGFVFTGSMIGTVNCYQLILSPPNDIIGMVDISSNFGSQFELQPSHHLAYVCALHTASETAPGVKFAVALSSGKIFYFGVANSIHERAVGETKSDSIEKVDADESGSWFVDSVVDTGTSLCSIQSVATISNIRVRPPGRTLSALACSVDGTAFIIRSMVPMPDVIALELDTASLKSAIVDIRACKLFVLYTNVVKLTNMVNVQAGGIYLTASIALGDCVL
jgi:hypothetical protein